MNGWHDEAKNLIKQQQQNEHSRHKCLTTNHINKTIVRSVLHVSLLLSLFANWISWLSESEMEMETKITIPIPIHSSVIIFRHKTRQPNRLSTPLNNHYFALAQLQFCIENGPRILAEQASLLFVLFMFCSRSHTLTVTLQFSAQRIVVASWRKPR